MNRLVTDDADRFAHGVGPVPGHSWIPRDAGVPAVALGQTAVCGSCGAPYLIAAGHSCPGRRAAR